MSQMSFTQYSSFRAFTPSDTTVVTCRGISCNVGGALVINDGQGGADVSITIAASQIYPIALTQGLIKAATAATGIVVYN